MALAGENRIEVAGSGWLIASGIMLLIAGAVALAAPGVTTVTLGIFLGWLLLLVGIAGIVMGLRARHRRWSDVALGALSVVVALYILVEPLAGAVSLTLAFAVWLGVRGVVELVAAFRVAGPLRWTLLLTGAINVVLAVALFSYFPWPAVQAVGVFVGVSFLIGGAMTLVAAVSLRRASRAGVTG